MVFVRVTLFIITHFLEWFVVILERSKQQLNRV